MNDLIRSTAGVLVAGLLAAGCSTAPSASDTAAADTALGNAGHAVDHAAADPHVARYAASELERAQDSLQQATHAWKTRHDLMETEHFAYLARQRAATAQELASERAAHEAVALAAERRDRAVAAVHAERRKRSATVTTTELVQEALAGFALGQSRLPARASHAIDRLATAMKNAPDSKLAIVGHTDSVGNPEYNQALAMKRAEAVRAALVRRGIDADRIVVRSLGEENPVASNGTATGRRENRRADIILGNVEEQMVGSSTGSTATTSSGQGQQNEQNER